MVYGPIGHSWAEWKPKGPARRFTGEETALRVLGSINDEITEACLTQAIDDIRRLSKTQGIEP